MRSFQRRLFQVQKSCGSSAEKTVDLVLLDIMLPGKMGTGLEEIPLQSQVPIYHDDGSGGHKHLIVVPPLLVHRKVYCQPLSLDREWPLSGDRWCSWEITSLRLWEAQSSPKLSFKNLVLNQKPSNWGRQNRRSFGQKEFHFWDLAGASKKIFTKRVWGGLGEKFICLETNTLNCPIE